jgi:hypothetical protein
VYAAKIPGVTPQKHDNRTLKIHVPKFVAPARPGCMLADHDTDPRSSRGSHCTALHRSRPRTSASSSGSTTRRASRRAATRSSPSSSSRSVPFVSPLRPPTDDLHAVPEATGQAHRRGRPDPGGDEEDDGGQVTRRGHRHHGTCNYHTLALIAHLLSPIILHLSLFSY